MLETKAYAADGITSIHSLKDVGLVVTAVEFNKLYSELQETKKELEEHKNRTVTWRELALQFDQHRMDAMWFLKGLVESQVTTDAVRTFLAKPPEPGRNVLKDRIAEVINERLGK